ncbi:MAG: Ku protein, partial [Candidatus Dormibacteraceae bacterium]
DQYVLLSEEEIKKIAPPSERTMEIQQFVKLSEVDPLYFHASYLAVPEAPGRKAYELLLKTLEQTERAALAKMSMHQREYLIIIRPRDNGLTLHTMYYAEEIRSVSEYGKVDRVPLKAQEVKLAKQLVENLTARFEPEKYHDEYQKRLKALIDSKQKGKKVASGPAPKLAPVIDITEALKRSLATREGAASRKQSGRVRRAKRMHRKAS